MEPLAPFYAQMTSYQDIAALCQKEGLEVLSGLHPEGTEHVPEGTLTLLLLGPDEPHFWKIFQKAPEWRDGQADPMDRWSTRVITQIAQRLGGQALFPFGGPPFLPFYTWALGTGRIFKSPLQFMVHDNSGLFVSFRGALALPHKLDLPDTTRSPCIDCPKPCLTACPVEAFDGTDYDVEACKSHLRGADTAACMTEGCAARRACPLSQSFGRMAEQSAYHMKVFLR